MFFVEEIIERIERMRPARICSGFADGQIRGEQPVGQLLRDRSDLVTFVLDSLSIHDIGDISARVRCKGSRTHSADRRVGGQEQA